MARISPLLGPSRLSYGALGVGEKHSKPDARRFTIEQIQAGRVRALFLEVKHWFQEGLDTATSACQDKEHFTADALVFGNCPNYQGQSIPLEEVAVEAVKCGVPVFCIDTSASDLRLRGADYKADNVQARDAHAVGLLDQHVNNRFAGDRTGCLVLFGLTHFLGLAEPYPDMQRDGWQEGVKQYCLADRLNIDYVIFDASPDLEPYMPLARRAGRVYKPGQIYGQ